MRPFRVEPLPGSGLQLEVCACRDALLEGGGERSVPPFAVACGILGFFEPRPQVTDGAALSTFVPPVRRATCSRQRAFLVPAAHGSHVMPRFTIGQGEAQIAVVARMGDARELSSPLPALHRGRRGSPCARLRRCRARLVLFCLCCKPRLFPVPTRRPLLDVPRPNLTT